MTIPLVYINASVERNHGFWIQYLIKMSLLSIPKLLVRSVKATLPYPPSSRIKVFFDYLAVWKSKGLNYEEYRLFDFYNQTDVFRKSFLGLNEQRFYLDYLNPIKYCCLSYNKFLTHKILENTGIRKSELYCYYQPEGRVIESESIANDLEGVCRILKAKGVKQCVVKTTESSHGNSVYVVQSIDIQEGDCILTFFNGKKEPLSAILGKAPLLFESVIRQTRQLASFNASSVNTVRFMTLLYPDNKARLMATFIKIGREGRCVDNAGGGGNVDACVDMETGELHYVIQFDGWDNVKDITNHPDSGTLLAGVKIENWKTIVEQVLHFQECFPYIKAAGWDIAITDDGPVVIEVNDFWDRTGQIFIRRGWRNEIRDCYLAWKKTGAQYPLQRQPNMLPQSHLEQIAKKIF